MIGYKHAIRILKKKFPNRTVIRAIDYDIDWYVLTAVEDVNCIDYNSPFFAVNKNTGLVLPFSPLSDLEKYTEAAQNHVLPLD